MQDTRLPPAIFLMGPTASGKTALAMALHDRFPVEIVSVDAAQVYRGLDIGTAKPSRQERVRAPHRLIDIREPSEVYSAADFRIDALQAMQEITAAGRIPLLVGGTMFYFRALERGLPQLPGADPALRAQLQREMDQPGQPGLYARLAMLDPARAARIHPNDPQRILRALEIIMLTGRTASSFGQQGDSILPYQVTKIALAPEHRPWLHQRIAARFSNMLAEGFLDEANALFARAELVPSLPAMRTVGYRQAGLYLSEKINYNQMVEMAITATRQLARRQLTWLRAETGCHWLDCSGAANIHQAALDYLFARLPV
ncbi:MAG TPA: tRNA (adenosine(37)-N6)-dimethylallyltransferase MiaA [Acidiferrobacterales bacterium]|nr:tRNA (adenosine(37)-N6)-dimethylallyltransferase MiaA [Acidiferrobacterales bacterium]